MSNSEGQSVSVINTATRATTLLQLTSAPQAIAMAPNGAVAYVANGDDVTPINLASGTPTLEHAISVPNGPLGIAVTPSGDDGLHRQHRRHRDADQPRDDAREGAGAHSPWAASRSPTASPSRRTDETAYVANATNTVTPIDIGATTPHAEAPVQVGSASFGIAIAPGQAPSAHLSVVPAPAGQPTQFDASGSYVTRDRRSRTTTGTSATARPATTTTATTSHVYAKPGTYAASVTAVGADGTSISTTFTGQTVSNNGSPFGRGAPLVERRVRAAFVAVVGTAGHRHHAARPDVQTHCATP